MTNLSKNETFEPIILLESMLSAKKRRQVRNVSGGLMFLFFISFILADLNTFSLASRYQALLFGFGLIFLAFWIGAWLMEFYFRSYYFAQGTEVSIEHKKIFEAAFLFSQMTVRGNKTITELPFGQLLLLRSGLSIQQTAQFLKAGGLTVAIDSAPQSFEELAEVMRANKNFAQFLNDQEVRSDDFVGSARWLDRILARSLDGRQWWVRLALAKIPSMAKDWAYGRADLLGQYGHELIGGSSNPEFGDGELKQMELVFAKEHDANVLLVGDEGVARSQIVQAFAARVYYRTVLPQLEGKRVVELDTVALFSHFREKIDLERELLRLLGDSISAGNIILLIPDLPLFIRESTEIGLDLPALLDPYLSSANLQVLAVADPAGFHTSVEQNGALKQRFNPIFIQAPEEDHIILALEGLCLSTENKYGLLFTYSSLRELADDAINYFPDGSPLDRADELLAEIAPHLLSEKKSLVLPEDVTQFVSTKSGVPAGSITGGEKEKLLSLESLLHQRIVGQDEAVSAISNAMRRARAGIRNMQKPIGSFLFLGPTGVGKTETAKALAAIFFGQEDAMVRIDMSEYQSEEGLVRLIGSFTENKTGVFTSIFKEKPYGVVLLDEFEKTNAKVLDLFLPILDEGFFTDAFGTRINVRNHIFIATSNAASTMIFDAVKDGKDLSSQKEKIMDTVIQQGTFKPELINRFDGVVLFHPLSPQNYTEIAKLLLQKVQKRLADKNIVLNITPELIETVAVQGADAQFGARPMNRIIQEKVENKIAQKMISGEARPGSTISLTKEELM